MVSMGGNSPGRKAAKSDAKAQNYERPAEVKGKAKKGKIPKGVSGQSLGGGAIRAKAGDKKPWWKR